MVSFYCETFKFLFTVCIKELRLNVELTAHKNLCVIHPSRCVVFN